MALQGFIRFRKHQVGVNQSSAASNVAATRILPYRGAIKYDPQRTFPDVDTGSLDPILAPFYGAVEQTVTWDGKAAFDDLPNIYGPGVKGGVTPTGSGPYTWTYTAASLTADPWDYVTDEWGDDATTDLITAGGGVIDSWSLTMPETLEVLDVQANLVFARTEFGDLRTGGLTIDSAPAWVYGGHTVIYMNSSAATIGITPLASDVHAFSFTVSNNVDRKRFANGSNTGFQITDFGRGPRDIEFKVTLAKNAQTIAEAQTLDDVPVPIRYFDIKTTSTQIAGGATPYSNSIRFPARLIARDDGAINNNSTIELTYRGVYDATLAYALRCVVVNARSAL